MSLRIFLGNNEIVLEYVTGSDDDLEQFLRP